MILVTGGTGLVGSHLLYALTKAGEQVRAIHRSESSFDAVKKVFAYQPDGDKLYQQIQWFEANLLDIPNLTIAFKGIKVVYHCAAYISFDPKKNNILRKTNILGTANIVNLALSHDIEKLCYVSSVATLGLANQEGLINEDCEWNPEDKNSVYSIAKYGAEMEVWRGSQEGLNTVIVNPGVILGEGHWDSASGVIFATAFKGIPFITKGSMGIVDVLDVTNAMIALTKSTVMNRRFVLVGHNKTYSQIFGLIGPALGKKSPKRYIAKFWLMALSKLDWLSSTVFRTKRKLVGALVNSLYKHDKYDASLIKSTVEFNFTPLEQTINRICDCYLSDHS